MTTHVLKDEVNGTNINDIISASSTSEIELLDNYLRSLHPSYAKSISAVINELLSKGVAISEIISTLKIEDLDKFETNQDYTEEDDLKERVNQPEKNEMEEEEEEEEEDVEVEGESLSLPHEQKATNNIPLEHNTKGDFISKLNDFAKNIPTSDKFPTPSPTDLSSHITTSSIDTLVNNNTLLSSLGGDSSITCEVIHVRSKESEGKSRHNGNSFDEISCRKSDLDSSFDPFCIPNEIPLASKYKEVLRNVRVKKIHIAKLRNSLNRVEIDLGLLKKEKKLLETKLFPNGKKQYFQKFAKAESIDKEKEFTLSKGKSDYIVVEPGASGDEMNMDQKAIIRHPSASESQLNGQPLSKGDDNGVISLQVGDFLKFHRNLSSRKDGESEEHDEQSIKEICDHQNETESLSYRLKAAMKKIKKREQALEGKDSSNKEFNENQRKNGRFFYNDHKISKPGSYYHQNEGRYRYKEEEDWFEKKRKYSFSNNYKKNGFNEKNNSFYPNKLVKYERHYNERSPSKSYSDSCSTHGDSRCKGEGGPSFPFGNQRCNENGLGLGKREEYGYRHSYQTRRNREEESKYPSGNFFSPSVFSKKGGPEKDYSRKNYKMNFRGYKGYFEEQQRRFGKDPEGERHFGGEFSPEGYSRKGFNPSGRGPNGYY